MAKAQPIEQDVILGSNPQDTMEPDEDLCQLRTSNASRSLPTASCATDYAGIALSLSLIYATLAVHLYYICKGRTSAPASSPPPPPNCVAYPGAQRLHGHNAIWICMLAQVLNAGLVLGEVIMMYARQDALFPVSAVEALLHGLASVVVPAYYSSVEEKRRGVLVLLPLLIHSFCTSCLLGYRLVQLTGVGFDWDHLRTATAAAGLVINASLFLLLTLAAAKKAVGKNKLPRRRIGKTNSRMSDTRESSVGQQVYCYGEASFLSKMTFSWMLPVLRAGYSSPLEVDDLGRVPEEEKAKVHYEALKKLDLRPDESIIRPCVAMNASLIAIAGVFRLFADLFGLAGALSIKYIVDFMSVESTRLLENREGSTNVTRNGTLREAEEATGAYSPQTLLATDYHALTIGEFFSDSYVITLLIFLAALGQGSFSQTSSHLLTVAGMRSRNALHVLLYEKALRLPVGSATRSGACDDSREGKGDEIVACFDSNCADDDEGENEGNIDIGYITNLASDDILNIREFVWNIHYLWSLPLKVVVLIGLLYTKMGVSGAVGVIIGTLVIVPLQFLTGKLMTDNNKKIFSAQDARLYKSTETMQGMKTVKLGCLEDYMLSKIVTARARELRFLRRDSFYWSIMAFLASVSTIIVSTVTVGLYVALEDEHFSAANIFSALALLGQLTVCLSVFPVTIPIFIKGRVSRNRLVEFFSRSEVSIYKDTSSSGRKPSANAEAEGEADEGEENEEKTASCGEELEMETVPRKPSDGGEPASQSDESVKYPEIAFSIANGTFAWPKTSTCVLRDIDVEVATGTLTAVVGPSGAGKTALISALLEEIDRLRGNVAWHLPSAVAFTGQNPWLLNASVRDNILLGRPFKEKRYQKVLSACDLNADIELLPDGDNTEVGERGVLLSGGQRQRLAIARCLYSKAACTFLDSPFSSLDSNITTHIFYQGVLGILLKRKRTVFMVTDRVDFLQKADHVLYLKEGRLVDQGKMDDLMKTHPELKTSVRDILTRSPSGIDSGLVEGKTAQERWRLLKNVTKWSIHMGHVRKEGTGDSASDAASVSSSVRHSGTCRKTLAKRMSSAKMALNKLRMDSSSQLSICHDIMLPSDEVGENGGVYRTGSKSRLLAGASAGWAPLTAKDKAGVRHKSLSNIRRPFARCSSWTNSGGSTLRRGTAGPLNASGVSGMDAASRRATNAGSSNLVRQVALSNNNSFEGPVPGVGGGGALKQKRNLSHSGEFHRMNSFAHMMAMKSRAFSRSGFNSSAASLSKDSSSIDSEFTPGGAVMSHSGSGYFSGNGSGRSRDSTVSVQEEIAAGVHTRVNRMTSSASAISGFSDDFHDDEGEDDGLILSRELSNQERREYGQIGVNVYAEYFRAGGYPFAALFLLLSVGLQCVKVYMDFLLRDWSLDGERTNVSYFSVYSSLSVTVLVVSCAANLVGQLIGARARRNMHESMLTNLVRCPLDYFEAYPIGRIINRFSYDVFIVDQKLPSSIQRLVIVSLICLSALVVNAIQSPLFIVCAVPMLAVYWWLQHYYRCTSRELQRLESISRTPVLSHFSDTLGGLVTVRAFGEQQRFINELCEKVDKNTTAFLVLQSGCRWLGLTLDYAGATMVFASVMINLVVCHWYPGEQSSASIGLSMNYSLLVPIYLAWVIKFLADIENYMNAVERILEYRNLRSEFDQEPYSNDNSTSSAEDQQQIKLLKTSKLSEGFIRFEAVSLSHTMDLKAVIQGLTIEIPPGQKVGICGRSGSGKSTLLMGLSRVAKVLYGSITIDGQDIRDVDLRTLRRFVWSVPQDVTLFSGTIRTNLDPESLFSDEEIWQALEKIGLKELIVGMEGGLDAYVMENGDNFSHGQKQEMSLARAILLQPRIVILDESTSALDAATEVGLHKQLVTAFASSTLITVAHRLSNLISYDRVLVMGEGKVLEDGNPRDLLKKPMGFFSALWRAAGEKPL